MKTKWTMIVLIGTLTVVFGLSGLVFATDNAQDNPNTIKKASSTNHSSSNGVVAKTQNALNKAATRTEQAVKKGVDKTGNFFKRIGNKTRSWFN